MRHLSPVRLIGLTFAFAILASAPCAGADEPPTFADRSEEDVRDVDRKLGLLLNPLAAAASVYGGEADLVLGRFAALALEGAVVLRGGSAATAFGTGLLVYPQGSALHGLFVEPRAVYARPMGESIARVDWSADALGLALTAGWQWTWDYGLSVRVGGGAMYFFGGPRDSTTGPLALGPEPVVDGSIGWAF